MSSSGAAEDAHRCDHAHTRSHRGGSPEAKLGDTPEINPAALLTTRVGILGLIGFVLYVTITFCTGVYFDRESAFHNALACSEEVMREAGVQHWLQNGTLLGATRLGRLVLWDADLDYGFLVDASTSPERVSAQLDERCFGYRTSQRKGARTAALGVWRKCTHRLCAEFHQAELVRSPAAERDAPADVVVTGDGASPAAELFPLEPCHVANVDAMCPRNAAFFLAQAYGTEWLTAPLAKLF